MPRFESLYGFQGGVRVAAGKWKAWGQAWVLVVGLAMAGTVFGQPRPFAPDSNPEAATGLARNEAVWAADAMVVSANPLASKAGLAILDAGGSATDALIAMQLVLGLVEPQSSGLGGGGFAIAYSARDNAVRAYDGRETAPQGARQGRFLKADGQAMPFFDAVHSGLSVGVPGLVALLGMLHERHGVLPWPRLFEPAILLAEEGFLVSPRLNALVEANDALRRSPTAAPYFFDAHLHAWPVGHRLRNPAYAQVLRTLAEKGPDAFYHGEIARAIVDAVRSHPVAGDLSLDDLAGYRALERDPLCMPYRIYTLCGPPPPSAGPLAVMQMLGILAHTPIATTLPGSADAVHYFAEAGRLAFADRDKYVADPGFVTVPTAGLLDPAYLKARAALIRPDASLGTAPAGVPRGLDVAPGDGVTPERPSTTHLVAIDGRGNAVSMTSSIETAFGSKLFVNGFLLNNQLTDFSLNPVDEQGRPVANGVEPGKRPRSSMAPMLVMRDGLPYMVIGSPGGSAIINYVAKTMLGVLDWGLDIQQAIDMPNVGSRNRATEVESGRVPAGIMQALRRRGHDVREMAFPSGLHGIVREGSGWEGGADPRREGVALGR
ncbi:MAG: gamma-glutamyltransferase [Burkholderiaceae bacterium]